MHFNDEDVKVCPECRAEFFAHVEVCNGCGVGLVRPENAAARAAAVPAPEACAAPHDLVCVEQGGSARLRELAAVLQAKAIPCEIAKEGAASKGCHSDTLLLLVPRPLAAAAKDAIEAHWLKLHPELKEAMDREQQGLCPACGSSTSASSDECPECGLNLAGPSGPGDDGGCNTC